MELQQSDALANGLEGRQLGEGHAFKVYDGDKLPRQSLHTHLIRPKKIYIIEKIKEERRKKEENEGKKEKKGRKQREDKEGWKYGNIPPTHEV